MSENSWILSNVTWIQNLIVELFPSKDQLTLLCVSSNFCHKNEKLFLVVWPRSDKARMSIFQTGILTQGTWPSPFLLLHRYSSVSVQKMTSSIYCFVLFSILINSIKAQNCEDIILEGCHSCGSCDTLFELEAENAAECQEKCTFLRLSKKYCKYFEFFENKVPVPLLLPVRL